MCILPLLLEAGITRGQQCPPNIHMGSGDLNSSLYTFVASSLIPQTSPQSCEHDPTGSRSGILFDSCNCVKGWHAFEEGEAFWFAFLNLILGVKRPVQP